MKLAFEVLRDCRDDGGVDAAALCPEAQCAALNGGLECSVVVGGVPGSFNLPLRFPRVEVGLPRGCCPGPVDRVVDTQPPPGWEGGTSVVEESFGNLVGADDVDDDVCVLDERAFECLVLVGVDGLAELQACDEGRPVEACLCFSGYDCEDAVECCGGVELSDSVCHEVRADQCLELVVLAESCEQVWEVAEGS